MQTQFKKGDIVQCWDSSAYNITEGRLYKVQETQAGIFEDRPFIRVVDDSGWEVWCHASRFKEPEAAPV